MAVFMHTTPCALCCSHEGFARHGTSCRKKAQHLREQEAALIREYMSGSQARVWKHLKGPGVRSDLQGEPEEWTSLHHPQVGKRRSPKRLQLLSACQWHACTHTTRVQMPAGCTWCLAFSCFVHLCCVSCHCHALACSPWQVFPALQDVLLFCVLVHGQEVCAWGLPCVQLCL
jgi:hypothetical protein